MKCRRCSGRCFLDRVFSDSASFEIYCVMCGDRRFVSKSSELGRRIEAQEAQIRKDRVIVG